MDDKRLTVEEKQQFGLCCEHLTKQDKIDLQKRKIEIIEAKKYPTEIIEIEKEKLEQIRGRK